MNNIFCPIARCSHCFEKRMHFMVCKIRCALQNKSCTPDKSSLRIGQMTYFKISIFRVAEKSGVCKL